MTDYPDFIHPTGVEHCQAAGCAMARAPYVTAKTVGVGNMPTPRPASTGSDLCNWHHAQFPRVLADLVNLHPDLVRAVYSRTTGRDENDRVSGGGAPADVGSSWNPHAAAVLAELADWTGYLIRMLEREHPRRMHLGIRQDDHVRTQLATIASWYAGWWSRYPFVGPYILADALAHRAAAMRSLHAEPVKKVTLSKASCRHIIQEDAAWGDLLCGAPLFAILRPEDGGKPSEILCSNNPNHPQLHRTEWLAAMAKDAARA